MIAAANVLAQVLIAIFGVGAIWLVASPNPMLRRWGPVCGLLAQPAWVWTTYSHEQWGILALTVLYTLSWARALRTHWRTAR